MSNKKIWTFIIGGTGEEIREELNKAEEKIITDYLEKNKNPLVTHYKKLEDELWRAIQDHDTNEIESLRQNLKALQNYILQPKTAYATYMPPMELLDSSNIILVQGARTIKMDEKATLAFQQGKHGKGIKRLKFKDIKLKDVSDHITAASEGKRIKECMRALEQAEKAGQLPEKIMLNGHSRGASASIELARAIYLKYGDQIKIDMNINDPVPGPFRHSRSKKVIPPNVESLVITYAGLETNTLFKPQDLRELFYDDKRTTVTTMVLPMTHSAMSHDVIKNINQRLWGAIDANYSSELKLPTVNAPVTGSRSNGKFIISTDPNVNENLKNNKNMKKFHAELRDKTNISLSIPQAMVTQNVVPTSRQERKNILKQIYSNHKQEEKSAKKFNKYKNGELSLNEFPELKGMLNEAFNWRANGAPSGKGVGLHSAEEVNLSISDMFSGYARAHHLEANVACLHSGNNTVIKITDPLTAKSMVLLLPKEVNKTVENIKDKPAYFRKDFYARSNEEANLILTEYCPSNLIQQAKELASLKETVGVSQNMIKKENNAKRIDAAVSVGKQVSTMLSDLNGRGLIWKDLKPENILLRQDGSIAVSDLKAFVRNNDPAATLFTHNTTTVYLPSQLLKNDFNHNENFKKTWEQIHNYQLAIILFHQVTDLLVVNDFDHNKADEEKAKGLISKFDFASPVFQTNEGRNLKLIITGLAMNKIAYPEAANLLNVIDRRESEFKKEIQKLPLGMQEKDMQEKGMPEKPGITGIVPDPVNRAQLVANEYTKIIAALDPMVVGLKDKKLTAQLSDLKNKMEDIKEQMNADSIDNKKLNADLRAIREGLNEVKAKVKPVTLDVTDSENTKPHI